RKVRPRTTCLYSAASILLRSLSAASQSLASKPMLAELLEEFLDFTRAIESAEDSRDLVLWGAEKEARQNSAVTLRRIWSGSVQKSAKSATPATTSRALRQAPFIGVDELKGRLNVRSVCHSSFLFPAF